MKAQLNKEGLISRAFLIEELAGKYGWDNDLEKGYNKIHTRSIQIRREEEKQLRKLKMGGIPWSPKLQQF